MNLSVDVVIPTFNGWTLTRSCLQHLAGQTRPHRVIVVDNGSTDGTADKVRLEFPETVLVELAANQGFSVACNRGVEAGGSDAIVLLNNDVDCPPGFLEHLVEPLECDELIGSVASVLVQPDGRTIDTVGLTADRTLAGFPRLRGRQLAASRDQQPVLSGPSGAGGAYRRTAWERVGGLDEGVFMYGEDIELALRLRAAGWDTALAADAVAIHLGSASIGHRTSGQRHHSGFARGYFLRRYGVLRGRAAARALVTEAIVVVGDAVLSRDLSALRGRFAGWRAAAGVPRRSSPPRDSIDAGISFRESVRLRRKIYSG